LVKDSTTLLCLDINYVSGSATTGIHQTSLMLTAFCDKDLNQAHILLLTSTSWKFQP